MKIEEINKELKRLTDNLAVMEQSLEASHSSVKLAEETLQKHKDGFKIKMNEKHQKLLNAQAAAKKAQEELDRLVQENKKIDDAVFGKSIFAQAEITSTFQTNLSGGTSCACRGNASSIHPDSNTDPPYELASCH